MKIKIYDTESAEIKEKEFTNFPILEEGKGVASLKFMIKAYLANARQGNACAKTRAEVRGSDRKPWNQKHTGNARHGSRLSPIWVGGGVTHGPRPRDYSQKVNRKQKRLAFSRALFDVAAEGNMTVVDSFKISQPKTKLFIDLLNRIYPVGKVLIIDDVFEDNTVMSARNIARVYICEAASLNAWDLIRYDKVIITKKALDVVLARVNTLENKE